MEEWEREFRSGVGLFDCVEGERELRGSLLGRELGDLDEKSRDALENIGSRLSGLRLSGLSLMGMES